ncbi:polyketide cyclase [Marinomonas sp. IMCC 4694]|uniref:polyketide cyclase n=1 Tax=Marinomonas sp. IMCC 4694 TaxID=2605432 RepID=UPI0011E7D188|nr:polyketide cyclase [Marinomonas sp. IMCC 4694]TYL48057.1 polyketide cyclase [Marinomonas sp. IMCC 4694]
MKTDSHPAALYTLRKVTRILAIIILLLVAVGFLLPSDYRVERNIMIEAPRDLISDNLLRGDYLPEWMYIKNGTVLPFEGVLKEGDSAVLSYNAVNVHGFISVVELSSNVIRFDVQPKPKVDIVHNLIALQSTDSGTLVAWTIEGNLSAGLLSPYLAFFANDIAGANFEKSLQQLKDKIEVLVQ